MDKLSRPSEKDIISNLIGAAVGDEDNDDDAGHGRSVAAPVFEDEDSEPDDLYDMTQKKQKTSGAHSDIPRVDASENIDSVTRKLSVLSAMQRQAETHVKQLEAEKGGRAGGDDEEKEDPLEAFMAGNNAELIDEQIRKEQERLGEIAGRIAEFQKLASVLSKNQFSDTNVQEAIRHRAAVARRTEEVQSAHIGRPRGSGTVWETELAKDTSVPTRVPTGQSRPVSVSVPVSLNPLSGGLHVTGAAPTEAAWVAPSEAQEKRQEDLRRKMGY